MQSSSDQVIQNVSSSEVKPDTKEDKVVATDPLNTTKDKIESTSSKTVTNDAKPMEDEGAQVAQKQSEKTDDLEKAYFNSVNRMSTKPKTLFKILRSLLMPLQL